MSPTSPYKRAPRLDVRSAVWNVGDLVQVDGTRWIIRSITGENVSLKASNRTVVGINRRGDGMWWHTTLAHLPKKEARP